MQTSLYRLLDKWIKAAHIEELLSQYLLQGILRSIIIAVVMATFWFLVVVLVIKPASITVEPWYDQKVDFTQAAHNLDDPWETPRYVYPPWAAVILIPFSIVPFYAAVLLQLWLTFGLLAILIHKYGGSTRQVWIVSTSFIAFDVGIEVNIDWISYLALLLPPLIGGPLLLIKPQVALGAYMGLSQRQQIYSLIGVIVVLLLSLAIWGQWGVDMLDAIERYTLTESYFDAFNLAPSFLMPRVVSWGIAAWFAVYAFHFKSPLAAFCAWFFFVPYMPFYSTFLYFGLLAIRLPDLAVIINFTMWVVFGGAILLVLFTA